MQTHGPPKRLRAASGDSARFLVAVETRCGRDQRQQRRNSAAEQHKRAEASGRGGKWQGKPASGDRHVLRAHRLLTGGARRPATCTCACVCVILEFQSECDECVCDRVSVDDFNGRVCFFILESPGGRHWLAGALDRRPEPQPLGEGGAAVGQRGGGGVGGGGGVEELGLTFTAEETETLCGGRS